MNVRVCGYASLCVCPVMDWTPVQGTTRGANSACVGPLSQAPTLNKQLRNCPSAVFMDFHVWVFACSSGFVKLFFTSLLNELSRRVICDLFLPTEWLRYRSTPWTPRWGEHTYVSNPHLILQSCFPLTLVFLYFLYSTYCMMQIILLKHEYKI